MALQSFGATTLHPYHHEDTALRAVQDQDAPGVAGAHRAPLAIEDHAARRAPYPLALPDQAAMPGPEQAGILMVPVVDDPMGGQLQNAADAQLPQVNVNVLNIQQNHYNLEAQVAANVQNQFVRDEMVTEMQLRMRALQDQYSFEYIEAMSSAEGNIGLLEARVSQLESFAQYIRQAGQQ